VDTPHLGVLETLVRAVTDVLEGGANLADAGRGRARVSVE
jgi:hypothetical protein